jgi:rhodanese-related sulfurtransferase
MEVKTISREELQRKIESGEKFNLVETLAPDKFEQAHLPGAINLPPEKLRELAPNLLPDKNSEVVVYCTNFT